MRLVYKANSKPPHMAFDTKAARQALGHPEDVPNHSEVAIIRRWLHDAIHYIERMDADLVPCPNMPSLLGALSASAAQRIPAHLQITPDLAAEIIRGIDALAKLRAAGIIG